MCGCGRHNGQEVVRAVDAGVKGEARTRVRGRL